MMQLSPQPITQDLVLVGGGHSHAIALKQFGMNPIPGVRLTLVTDVAHTPYSGMLPGYVAGLYSFDDCHIDLRPLTQFAQASMVLAQATGLDLAKNQILFGDRPPLAFDLLSLDIGSTPATLTVPGAAAHTIPVKPISRFLHYWDQLTADLAEAPNRPLSLAVVGGGAGGVELALAVWARLHQSYQTAQQSSTMLELHLFHRSSRLLPERSAWVGQKLEQVLMQRGVKLHLRETVSAVEESANGATKVIRCESGLKVECDRIFWVTKATAADWLTQSGLDTNKDGFVQVNDSLQSTSHPQIFAAGDIASMANHSRPKAGVFAVRQGKPLFQNLRRALLNQPLHPFVPQKEFLILIGTGDRKAIASRGSLGLGPHPLIWRWKDSIDRQFMTKFSHLKPMQESGARSQEVGARDQVEQRSPVHPVAPTSPIMRCAGCGSKVGSSILEQALNRIKLEQREWCDRADILIGLDAPDDAAVISVPVGQVMVQTIDYFRALMDDPFLFGQICTNHCLSDIYAMGASPQSALAIATLPYASAPKLEETLYQLLSGAVKVLNQAQAPLIGGHTVEGSELALGLTCNGLADPDRLWRKSGMKPGQVLILTKALGTGTLFAAEMQLQAKGRWIESAIQSMLLSNQGAAACFRQHQATACTDVTGFGLLGHLLEMVRASGVAVELDLNAIPVLDGAKETVQQGWVSSLHPQNLQVSRFIQNLSQVSDRPLYPLLFDPQTSGGLVASIPAAQAQDCLTELKTLGYLQSRIIGQVLSAASEQPVMIKS